MSSSAPGRSRVRRAVGALATGALVAAGLAVPGTAAADPHPPAGTPATVSTDSLPTWQVNGVVWSQVVVRNAVFVTGSFTKARPPGVAPGGTGELAAQNIFAYDITTGKRLPFSHALNAQGRVITASPDGMRVFVGGDFTSVTTGGTTHARGHVASFRTDTGALEGFRPKVSSAVRALAASPSALYIGGSFGYLNGSSRKGLGAVSSTGATLKWAPKIDSGRVQAMVLAPDRSRVIVGGSFKALNGLAAYGMGSLSAGTDVTTPTVLEWRANKTIRNAGSAAAINSLRTDGKQIFGSGFQFATTAEANFEGTFAADPTTGAITVVNDCHGDTYDVVPIGPVLYSVGHAHDCRWIRDFPDTDPRVRWQRALAQTIAPTTTNIGPDNYGWNYNGLPASTNLHWFPQMPVGTYTGQYQAGWTIAGNSSYVVFGGEFPSVNGIKQQGLARMAVPSVAPTDTVRRGPTYATKPSRPVPATTATPVGGGQIKVDFGTAWDYDNATLTYDVLRDNKTWVHSRKVKTSFWKLPNQSFTDSGLAPGTTHYYQVRVKDSFGKTLWSPKSSTVTAS